MKVITRFAPSPTGFLHIGGARTALYNWLFAKHHQQFGEGGEFLLRIEDTDRERSTVEAVQAIYEGLRWLGLGWDRDPISQNDNIETHQAVAKKLVALGKAYRCYCSPQELTEMRDLAKKEGRSVKYNGFWRNRDEILAPKGVTPVIRLKAPKLGTTIIQDSVQGEVKVKNEHLDDMILLRSDGSPTYTLAVVSDDHHMGVTHVIRGDDHLTNAFRQYHVYKALEWVVPKFAHIPLIHGADGAKMSKRHGALGVGAYELEGFLPKAVCNYLLRLGWGHGNNEQISINDAIKWFGLENIGKSPARFDFSKLLSLNSYYLSNTSNAELIVLIKDKLEEKFGEKLSKDAENRVDNAMSELKKRSKTMLELVKNTLLYVKDRPIILGESVDLFFGHDSLQHLHKLMICLGKLENWTLDSLSLHVQECLKANDLKLKDIGPSIRVALLGVSASQGIYDIMLILGQKETCERLNDCLNTFIGLRKISKSKLSPKK